MRANSVSCRLSQRYISSMKFHFTTLLIALLAGYFGGISSHLFTTDKNLTTQTLNAEDSELSAQFHQISDTDDINTQVNQLKLMVNSLTDQVNTLSAQNTENSNRPSTDRTEKTVRRNRPVSPSRENLIAAGINPDNADDILRRMSQQEFRRLELQNLIRRGGPSGAQYRTELRDLNQNKISLRSELGDDAYDQYLYASGQNNRVKVSSVMSGSPAELSGFEKDDVILFYDDKKVLSWPDIRAATFEGEIGSYTSVEILRDGSRMSLMVPRGTLGVQLDAVQLDPAE